MENDRTRKEHTKEKIVGVWEEVMEKKEWQNNDYWKKRKEGRKNIKEIRKQIDTGG